jgi:cytochrome c-type biogenesis protein CcmE
MPKNLPFVIGVSLAVAAIAYLVVTAVRNTAEYYLTVNEAKARQAELSGQMLRISGRVVPGTIQWDPSSLTLQFTITEPPPADGSSAVTKVAATVPAPAGFLTVSRGQPKPDMFAAGRDVIVEGILQGNTIQSRQVLTSCPSKYSPKQNNG